MVVNESIAISDKAIGVRERQVQTSAVATGYLIDVGPLVELFGLECGGKEIERLGGGVMARLPIQCRRVDPREADADGHISAQLKFDRVVKQCRNSFAASRLSSRRPCSAAREPSRRHGEPA